MSTDQLSLLFALLTLVALGLAAGVGVALLVVRDPDVRAQLQPFALPLAFLVAATATGGSLYYSEGAGFTPCELCWYQRIAMYPLAPILGIAALRRDPTVLWYALPLSVVGAVISVYHYQLQLFPGQGSSCDPSAPCTARWVEELGFISIPFMALAGFAAVTALVVAARAWASDPLEQHLDEQPTQPPEEQPADARAPVVG